MKEAPVIYEGYNSNGQHIDRNMSKNTTDENISHNRDILNAELHQQNFLLMNLCSVSLVLSHLNRYRRKPFCQR